MDKLSSMKVFIRVVEANSFSLAATQLGIGSAAVTRSIASLEKSLGVKLMERTTRRISLTAAGAAYLDCCRKVLRMIESTESDLAGQTLALSGPIRVGLSNFHGHRIFAPTLMRFAKAHPGIALELLHVDTLADALALDADITLHVCGERRLPYQAVSLGPVEMALVGAPDYFERHGRPAHPVDLVGHRCLNLSLQPNRPVWQFIEEGVIVAYPVNACLNTRNGDGLIDAAVAGLGMACIPVDAVSSHLLNGSLQTALEAYPLAPCEASLTIAADKLVMQRTKVLAGFIAEQFACIA